MTSTQSTILLSSLSTCTNIVRSPQSATAPSPCQPVPANLAFCADVYWRLPGRDCPVLFVVIWRLITKESKTRTPFTATATDARHRSSASQAVAPVPKASSIESDKFFCFQKAFIVFSVYDRMLDESSDDNVKTHDKTTSPSTNNMRQCDACHCQAKVSCQVWERRGGWIWSYNLYKNAPLLIHIFFQKQPVRICATPKFV